MRKINILHLADNLKIGGLERIIFDIATGLDQNKYKVSVWCFKKGGEILESLNKNNIEIKIIDFDSYYNFFNFIKLAILVKKHSPDIIHSHTYFSNTIGRIAGMIARVPVIICHVHNVYYNYSKRNFIIERFLSFYTDKIICCSEAVRNFVEEKEKIKKEKIITIYNGVKNIELPKNLNISNMKKSLGIYGNKKTIICIASLTEKKGHEYLIKAISKIANKIEGAKFLFVGDGPLRKRLEKLAENLDIKNLIIFTGIRNDIPNLLRISDIFVLASLTEGLPLAAIEAMSVGIPVITTAVGGMREIIQNGITGYLVPPKNSEIMANSILNLAENEKAAKEIGENAKKFITENFSLEKMIYRTQELYIKSLENKKIKNLN